MIKFAELMKDIKEDKIIFIISHDLERLFRICDKVINLEDYVTS
ncbi:MAG: hypothetical protein Q4P28_05220 [Tissierellia bacterium]|nr:hypothetical protein [Tissierellia bacterium]